MSSFGIDRERQVRRYLEEEGWVVARAAGSFGEFDLMAARPKEAWLVEVKATAAGPYAGFGPSDRSKLRALAERAGATPILAWWPRRGKLKFIPASEWPDGNV